jgi:hypothetical protein
MNTNPIASLLSGGGQQSGGAQASDATPQPGVPAGMAPVMPPGMGGEPQLSVLSSRHASALTKYLHDLKQAMQKILDDPDTGRVNIRTKLFDIAADNIGKGVVTVPQVINDLSTLPKDPMQQRAWLRKKIADNEQAQLRILTEQAQLNPVQGDAAQDWAATQAMPEPKDGFLREAAAHWHKRRKR